MAGPLSGYTVLDFGRFQAGPLVGVWLADLGANVIKVEARAGDPIRGSHPAAAAIVTAHNRGKRSLAVDATRPEGRDLILRLAERADVLSHNFRIGVMERLGLGYDVVAGRNPAIVYCGISMYGPKGPRSMDPGNDTIGQAMGGLAYVTGVPGGSPLPAGSSIADSVAAFGALSGILAALLERTSSGEGQLIDASLYGTQIAIQSWETGYCSITGELPVRNGGYPYLSGYGIYPTSDGSLAIGGLTDRQWPVFCAIIQREDLVARWPSARDRLANVQEVARTIGEYTCKRPTAHWVETLANAGLVVSTVQSYADVVQDEQAIVNGYVLDLEHDLPGRYRGAGSPWTFSRTPVEPGHRAPDLAAHTEEVLLEFGFSWEEIGALGEAGVIGMETA